MAKVTWLGEDELHGNGAGPSFTRAFGDIKFPKGEAVEVRSNAIVQKALGNQFFEVEDADDVDDGPSSKPKRGRPSNAEKEAKAKDNTPMPEPLPGPHQSI
jgi:hypothetical protein